MATQDDARSDLLVNLELATLLTVTWLPFLVVGAIWWFQDNYTPARAAIWFSGFWAAQ